MDAEHEDTFVVFVREHCKYDGRPEVIERAVSTCPTYEEACRVRQRYQRPAHECVIRYVGPAGGGD